MANQHMEQYQVEKILQKRPSIYDKTKLQFRIKWKGYSIQQSTWQPQENLENCRILMRQFFQRQNKSKQKIIIPQQKQVPEVKYAMQIQQEICQNDKQLLSNNQDFYFQDEQQMSSYPAKEIMKNKNSPSQKSSNRERGRPRKDKALKVSQKDKQKNDKNLNKKESIVFDYLENIKPNSNLRINQTLAQQAKQQKQTDNFQIKQSQLIQQKGCQVQFQFNLSRNIKILSMHYRQNKEYPWFTIQIEDDIFELTYNEVYDTYPFALAQFYSQLVQFYPLNLSKKQIKKKQKGMGRMTKLKKDVEDTKQNKQNNKDKQKMSKRYQGRMKMRKDILQQVQQQLNSSQEDDYSDEEKNEQDQAGTNMDKIQETIHHHQKIKDSKVIIEQCSQQVIQSSF